MTSSITAAVLSQIPPLPSRKIPFKSHILQSFVSTKEHKTRKRVPLQRSNGTTASSGSGSPAGLYSAQELELELNLQNVDTVLEEVRPYLIADGGNVDVVSVEDGVISLKLQESSMLLQDQAIYLSLDTDSLLFSGKTGACGTCPSSTTTMKMGIERILKEKFGKAVKDIQQVYDEQISKTTVEAVNGHLDILRPAIKNFGGSVEVLSVEDGNCLVKYEGPESIGSGIKAAIKEKFPDIINVVFSS